MNDFHKPYEYNEEKRGFLLVFIIMLLSVDPFQAFSFTVRVYGILSTIPVLGVSFLVIAILYILFIPLTVISCYHLKKNMITLSKAYLIVRTVFLTGCILLLFFNAISNKSIIANGSNDYKTIPEITFFILVGPLIYNLGFSFLWYRYFLTSKRCQELSKKTM